MASGRTAALNRMHVAVKEMMDQLELIGSETPDGLEDLKSAVDEVRLRLWGVLMAAHSPGDKGFGDRFRLRRVTEIIQGIIKDVDAGRLQISHKDGADLGMVARELARRVTAAHAGG
jgi:hypothetical protein